MGYCIMSENGVNGSEIIQVIYYTTAAVGISFLVKVIAKKELVPVDSVTGVLKLSAAVFGGIYTVEWLQKYGYMPIPTKWKWREKTT